MEHYLQAWLVVNQYLQQDKFSELHQWLLVAAGKHKISMVIHTNAEVYALLDADGQLAARPDFVLFWDKDFRLARLLEGLGLPVFNSADAILTCDDKSRTYLALKGTDIPMPKTLLAPFTYDNIGYTDYDFLRHVEEQLGFPLVVKECFGSFGAQVYLVHNREELVAQVKKIGAKPMLFQAFLALYAGSDLRLQVVGDRVVAAMLRYSENGDFRANITNGGKMESYRPSTEQIELAVRACQRLGLTYAGVDLLFGDHEEPVLCEVNSNAHFKNIHSCTGVNAADAIMEELVRRMEVRAREGETCGAFG